LSQIQAGTKLTFRNWNIPNDQAGDYELGWKTF